MKLTHKHIVLYLLSFTYSTATLHGWGGGGPGQGSSPAENDGFPKSEYWPESDTTGMTYYNKIRDVAPNGKVVSTTTILGATTKKDITKTKLKSARSRDTLEEEIMRDIQAGEKSIMRDIKAGETGTKTTIKKVTIEYEE